jgi:hypothetical protein
MEKWQSEVIPMLLLATVHEAVMMLMVDTGIASL